MSFLVEWYRPEITEIPLDDLVSRLGDGALSAEDTTVHLLMALAIPADEIVLGVFAADSAELVGDACTRAGMPPGRLTAVHHRELRPGDYADELPSSDADPVA